MTQQAQHTPILRLIEWYRQGPSDVPYRAGNAQLREDVFWLLNTHIELLFALQIALRDTRESMSQDDRHAFDSNARGPSWMFTAKDAIARAKGR